MEFSESLTPFPAVTPFDPSEYVQTIKRKNDAYDYLDVGRRVQWVRAAHPDWSLRARLTHYAWDGNKGYATADAEVVSLIPDGLGGWREYVIASSSGTETSQDFRDFAEKACTKALGRALAAAGFSTDAAIEFEVGDAYHEAGRFADGERQSRSQEGERQSRPQEGERQSRSQDEGERQSEDVPQPPKAAPKAKKGSAPGPDGTFITRPSGAGGTVLPLDWARRIDGFAVDQGGEQALHVEAFTRAWKESGKTTAQLAYMLGGKPSLASLTQYLSTPGKASLRDLVGLAAADVPSDSPE